MTETITCKITKRVYVVAESAKRYKQYLEATCEDESPYDFEVDCSYGQFETDKEVLAEAFAMQYEKLNSPPQAERSAATMDFNQYQEEAKKTAIYPASEKVFYPLFGLAGEVGELCNKAQKIIRDDGKVISEEKRKDLLKECGDAGWFLSAVISDLGGSFEEVMKANIEKLKSRQERGTLGGSGDNR